MSRTIRLLTILAIAIAYCVVMVLCHPTMVRSILDAFHSESPCEQIDRPPLYDSIVALSDSGRHEEAARLIARGQHETSDSIAYYQYETLAAKHFFRTMKGDSMRRSTERLSQFLKSQTDTTRLELIELAMLERTQRGVMAAKLTGRMDTALACYHEAMRLVQKLPCHKKHRMLLLTNLADAYRQAGRYDETIECYRQATELGDTIGLDTLTLINIDIGVASSYAAMANYERSAVWWEKVRQLLPSMDRFDQFQYLNNRGYDYYLQERYAESLECFMRIDSLVGSHPDMVWERMFGRANLSDVYIKLRQTDRARPLIAETEDFFTREQQPIPLYYLATQRIELALLDGHTAEAARLAATSVTPDWMIPEQKLLRNKVLLRLYEQQGDWRHYAAQLQDIIQLSDSIISDKAKMQLSVALLRFDHQRTMLDKQRQLEQMDLSFRWAVAMLLVAAVVIVLIVIIALQKLRERRAKELIMQGRIASLRMETVRNRITPHFIGNALATEMVAQMDGKQADLDALVQLLHRGSEMTGTEQTSLGEELEFINFYCGIESRSIGPDFELKTELADDVDPNTVKLPAMFLQILVENSLKHGLKPKPQQEGSHRTVLIKATRKGEGTQVEVIDNGVGLPRQKRIEHTGLKVVRQTMQLLNEQNRQQMDFSIGNYTHADGSTGCRAAIFLPDDYHYTIKTT